MPMPQDSMFLVHEPFHSFPPVLAVPPRHPKDVRAPFTGFASPLVSWCLGALVSRLGVVSLDAYPPWHGTGTVCMYGRPQARARARARAQAQAQARPLPLRDDARPMRRARPLPASLGSHRRCATRVTAAVLDLLAPHSVAQTALCVLAATPGPVSPCLCSAVAVHIFEGSCHGPRAPLPPERPGAFR